MPLDAVTTEIASLASRRGLLRTAGFGAAMLGAASVGFTREADAQSAITDEDILNFALNLEYLEAEFYQRAVYGRPLGANVITGTGTPGKVSGGSQVPFSSTFIMELAREIANDELDHVLFLRKALGSKAIARPAIDLDTSFAAVGQVSGAFPAGTTFNPFSSDDMFLLGAFIFEDVGVTAYSGAAPAIKNKNYLAAAAGILAVEAYHASELRLLILQASPTLAKQANDISQLRAMLSNASDDQGPVNGSTPNIVPADSNSIAFARTPAQVLNVVYGGGAASNYLFFPNKTNGAIS